MVLNKKDLEEMKLLLEQQWEMYNLAMKQASVIQRQGIKVMQKKINVLINKINLELGVLEND